MYQGPVRPFHTAQRCPSIYLAVPYFTSERYNQKAVGLTVHGENEGQNCFFKWFCHMQQDFLYSFFSLEFHSLPTFCDVLRSQAYLLMRVKKKKLSNCSAFWVKEPVGRYVWLCTVLLDGTVASVGKTTDTICNFKYSVSFSGITSKFPFLCNHKLHFTRHKLLLH